MTIVFTALLVAPAFLYDLTGYVTTSGDAGALVEVPIAYAIVVGLVSLGAIWLARSRYGWLAAAAAVAVATPRLFVYDATYLLVGMPSRAAADPEAEG